MYQSWSLRPRSYDKTGLRPASVLVLVLYFWSWSWSWSYNFGLGLGLGLAALVLVLVLVLYFWSCIKHCCARQALCDMIMLKCNKHLYFSCNKCRNSTKCNWSSYHFLTFFAQSYFLTSNMRVATKEFFCYVVLLLLNWSWSWSYSFGLDLGLGLNILVLFPSLACICHMVYDVSFYTFTCLF